MMYSQRLSIGSSGVIAENDSIISVAYGESMAKTKRSVAYRRKRKLSKAATLKSIAAYVCNVSEKHQRAYTSVAGVTLHHGGMA